MESSAIPVISQQVQIKCKRCGFEGEITATRVYYTNCPDCDFLVYVGHLTSNS